MTVITQTALRVVGRVCKESSVLGDTGILNVSSFLNHQVDAALIDDVGRAFSARFCGARVTKVLTAEVSGIAPALATATALGVPLVYARKRRPVTMMGKCHTARAASRTKGGDGGGGGGEDDGAAGGKNTLHVATAAITSADRVLIVDDFLATGETASALAHIVCDQARATLVGIACVIEKPHERGAQRLARVGLCAPDVDVVSLVRVVLEPEMRVSVGTI